MKVLHLTLKKKWFDMIASGDKPDEYREINEWIVVRLLQMTSPLVIDRAGNMYTTVSSAFWYAVGLKKHRVSAVHYLLKNCCEWRNYDAVCFRNGYRPESPTLTRKLNALRLGTGNPLWGAEPGKKYFVIKLGDRLDEEPRSGGMKKGKKEN